MDDGKKTFSIVVPVYNVEDYLAQCLDSLLAQTYLDFEVIVVDDASTDSSRSIVRAYAQRGSHIRLVSHTVNKGLGGARNTGLEAATGEYLLFLDSDDYLHPETLEKLWNVIKKTGAQLVEYCFRLVDEDGKYLSRTFCQEESDPLLRYSVNACNKAFHRSLFASGEIRFPEKRYFEDYWTIPKLLLQIDNGAQLNEDLYFYRQRAGSIVHDTNAKKNTDILAGTDCLLEYVTRHGFGEDVRLQLEYLATVHVLYHATLRVNDIDWRSPLQKDLKAYMQSHFPNWKNNPYRDRITGRQRRILGLIEGEQYFLLYGMWHCRNRVSGFVRRMLPRRG